jgi:hypothetical protein
MSSKRRLAKQQKLPATALDEQQRKLEEKARALREQTARYEEFLAKAPEIKKERERVVREELVKARSRNVPALCGARTKLPDYRHEDRLNVGTTARRPRLRSERSQGRLTFFILLIGLIGVLAWAYTTFSGR